MKKITLLILLVSLFALTKAQMPIYDDLQVYGTATFEKDIDVGDSVTSPIGHFDTLRFENGTYQVTAGISKSDSIADTYTANDSITTPKLIADTIEGNSTILRIISDAIYNTASSGYLVTSPTIGISAGDAVISMTDDDFIVSGDKAVMNLDEMLQVFTGSEMYKFENDTLFADGSNSSTANTFKFKTGFIDDSLTADKLIADKVKVDTIIGSTDVNEVVVDANLTITDTAYTKALSIGGAAVADTSYSSAYVMENTKVDKLQFNPVTQAHSEGTLFYDSVEKSLSFYNEFADFKEEFGRGVNLMFYNNTGSTINNGAVVRPIGAHKASWGSIIFEGDLAGNASLDSIIGVAVATHDVLDGEYGMCTVLGKVNGLNTSAFSDNDVIFVGHEGEFTNVPPEPPLWYQVLGRVGLSDNDSGTVYVKTGVTKYVPTPTFTASFEDSTETITNTGLDVFEPITSATNSLFGEKRNYGFTFQGDSISPKQAGTYNIMFSYSFIGTASQTDLYRVGTFIDGVKGYSTSRTASGTNAGGVPYTYEVYLTAGQWISFRIANTTIGTRDCVFLDGVVTINYEQ